MLKNNFWFGLFNLESWLLRVKISAQDSGERRSMLVLEANIGEK